MPPTDSATPLPSAQDMERSVLSCMMQAPDYAIGRAMGKLRAEDFHNRAHSLLFSILVEMMEKSIPVDPASIQQILIDRQQMESVGGPVFIAEICVFAPTPSHVDHYAGEVRSKAGARRVMLAAFQLIEKIQTDPEDWLEHATEMVDACVAETSGVEARATIVPIRDAIFEAVDELEEALKNKGHVTHGLATGFTDLDRCLMGLRPGQNVVVAGRPSMGKTALVVNILENLAMGEGHYKEFYLDMQSSRHPRQGQKPVVLVCLESSQVEMAGRMLCGRARVSLQRIRDGLLKGWDVNSISRAGTELGASPFYIWDAAGISVEELEVELKSFKLKVPTLAAVSVDHCGLLRAKGVKDAGNDYARIGYISSRLRLLWKTLGVVGFPLWQLSREVEKRGDKRPKLSDLRDSGKIEEDATQVLMPFRPAYYDNEQPEDEAYLIVGKNRGGPVNSEGFKLKWEAQFTRFSSLTDRLLSNNKEQHQTH